MKAAIEAPLGRLFNASEAAEFLGMKVSKVHALITAGRLPALRHPSGRLEGIYEADCRAFQEKRIPKAPARPVSIDARMAKVIGSTRRFG